MKSVQAGFLIVIVGMAGVLLWPWVTQQGGWAQSLTPLHQEAIEQLPLGEVNWTEGTISASGIGVPRIDGPQAAAQAMAKRAALVVALRNLLELVKAVRVDSETRVENFMVKSDEIESTIDGFVRGAQIVKTDIYPHGGVEVFVTMPLWGTRSVTSALLDEKRSQSQELTQSPAADTRDDEGYTGVSIDTRGLGLRPATFPLVLDEDGEVIYGPEIVSRQAAERYGLVQYYMGSNGGGLSSIMTEKFYVIRPVKSRSETRAGRRPLKVKGIGKSGRLKANVIISSEDARKIRDNAQVLNALKGAKVIIVTDPLIAGIQGWHPNGEWLMATRLSN